MSKFRKLNADERKFLSAIAHSKEKEYGMPATDYKKLEKRFGKRKVARISQRFFESGIMFEKSPKRIVLLSDNPTQLIYKEKMEKVM